MQWVVQRFHGAHETGEPWDIQIAPRIRRDVVKRHTGVDSVNKTKRVIRGECVNADPTVYAAGHVVKPIEAASQAVGKFELGLGNEAKGFVEVRLVQGLDLGGVEWQFFVWFVACDCDVAFVVGFAVRDVPTANDRIQFAALFEQSDYATCMQRNKDLQIPFSRCGHSSQETRLRLIPLHDLA